ncbi:MAG: decaprenyl-phosphate phosphoribosyltransferase [Cyclobacteriaceae bacterium]|nr:decaprenyl-phosphate phosphoribosyltransferase [Cyclobacteriaceae bacterium]
MLLIKLFRVHHWVKNFFVFVPIFFAGQIFDFNRYNDLILAFLSFSLVASSIYVFNDIADLKADQLHPKKKLRPIASGKITKTTAWILCGIALLGGLGLAYLLNTSFQILLISYLVINASYSMGLKHFSIVDIFLVASGFLIRIYAGGVVSSVAVSHWLAIMIMLLSLFLALAKRRDDIILNGTTGELRKSVRHYNLDFINSCLSIFSGVIIVAYLLYTVSPEVIERFNTDWLFLTSLFVIAGIMRYLQITFVEQNSGSPTSILLRDKFIIGTLIGWVISFYIIIYIQ